MDCYYVQNFVLIFGDMKMVKKALETSLVQCFYWLTVADSTNVCMVQNCDIVFNIREHRVLWVHITNLCVYAVRLTAPTVFI